MFQLLTTFGVDFPKELKEEYLNISNVSRHHMGNLICDLHCLTLVGNGCAD